MTAREETDARNHAANALAAGDLVAVLGGAMTASFPEIVKGAVDRSLAGVHTGIPATVLTYNPALQQVSCQPVVSEMPALEDVPVWWPRAGVNFLHMLLTPGSTVYLLFAEQDFGPWRVSGTQQAPALLRRHGMYAIALPGGGPDTQPLTGVATHTGVSLGQDGGVLVHIGATGIDLGAFPATQAAALAALVDAALAAMVATFNGHTHLYIPGPGSITVASATPLPQASTPSPTGSSVVRLSG